ncbi:hypothetical protein EJ02DRAFT_491285 [Clathrospora elynae]|uniref:Uncharacterized protein n=1 Tax=Clathrospora elynae TaxID=706981 RepID=A0A6A5SPK5_9PLEO|nr:hypothetical protein EJ02DRAFT_491285 [Clathrospora elynae]
MDKKGFMLGVVTRSKRVFSRRLYEEPSMGMLIAKQAKHARMLEEICRKVGILDWGVPCNVSEFVM